MWSWMVTLIECMSSTAHPIRTAISLADSSSNGNTCYHNMLPRFSHWIKFPRYNHRRRRFEVIPRILPWKRDERNREKLYKSWRPQSGAFISILIVLLLFLLVSPPPSPPSSSSSLSCDKPPSSQQASAPFHPQRASSRRSRTSVHLLRKGQRASTVAV